MWKKTGSKLGKEYDKAVYCHPAYLYAEYIMLNAGLDDSQAGIKIAKEISTTSDIMAESEEELKSLFLKFHFAVFKLFFIFKE